MITANVNEFLSGFSTEDLQERGVLRGNTNLLQGTSVKPLMTLMEERHIQRLECPQRGWFLDRDGSFRNPSSNEITEGRVTDLANPGSIFADTNNHINPHYLGITVPHSVAEDIEELDQITFGLERDLQRSLRQNMETLEQGLRITDGGNERSVEGGRIDITAEDAQGQVIAVELKAGTANLASIGQILAYMSCLSEEESKSVRGILVAGDFDKRAVLAAKAIPNLDLRRYSVNFSFTAVS